MTQAQKSLKNKFQNSALHLNAQRQIVDEHEIPVGGGGTTVIPGRERVEGKPTFRSLMIGTEIWNAPTDGGEGGTEVIPSESPIPHGKLLASLKIDGEAWNIPNKYMNISLSKDPESPMRWVGSITEDNLKKVKAGYFVSWYFDGLDEKGMTVTNNLFSTDGNTGTMCIDLWDMEHGSRRLSGIIDFDAEKEEHSIVFILTDYGTIPLPEEPEDAPIAKGLRYDGTDWKIVGSGGSEVIPLPMPVITDKKMYGLKVDGEAWNLPKSSVVEPNTQSAGGARTCRSMAIDGVIWNMPVEGGGGGGGGDGVWGQITGNIEDQTDLMNKFAAQDTKINGAVATANDAKSVADKAKKKADDAKDKADSAHSLATAAEVQASAADALCAELEYRVEWNISPAIAALEGSVATLEGQMGTKASIADVDAVNTRVTQLRQDLEALTRRVDGYDERIREIWSFLDNEVKQRFTFVESAEPQNNKEE